MQNIVVVGAPGAGINFLKNIFLLSDKLRFDLPCAQTTAIDNRYLFMLDYYTALLEKTKNFENWLDHEWSLRMSSHWTDELDEDYCLVKINNQNPTVFALHNENEILVTDPITVVSVEVDDSILCDRLYRIKSNDDNFTNLNHNALGPNPIYNRSYLNILFTQLLNSTDKIYQLTESLDMGIDLHAIDSIHSLWADANRLLLTRTNL